MTVTARPSTSSDTTIPWCLSDHHLAWRDTIREFCSAVVAPTVEERDAAGQFDAELVGRIADLGIFGLLIPEQHGGTGGDLTSFCLAIEELARVDSSLAVTVHVQSIVTVLFDSLANPRQRELYLDDMMSGRAFAAFGLTEPTGGSDAGNIGTRAVRDGSEWVINGAKQFITNSGTPLSRYIVLFAATGEGDPGRPIVSAFLVPVDATGFTVAPAYRKMGWRSSDTHPLFFDDVRVEADALLGIEGRGYRDVLAFLSWARIPVAAMGVGVAQGCLDATRTFVASRSSFGQALGSHQGVAFGVADIAAAAATARLVTYDAAWKYDHGQPYDMEAAMCKLTACELANQAAYRATQLHGGYGFVEGDVARHYRDARILTIGEGTSDVQRLVIARLLGLPV